MANQGIANGNEQSSDLDVPHGLFVLRYAETQAREAPVVVVQPAPGSGHLLDVISCPGTPANILSVPGDHLVLSSNGGARVRIVVRSRSGSGSTDARLALEPLAQVKPSPAMASSLSASRDLGSRSRDDIARDRLAVSLIAHVARRGDVAAKPGQWIAGPEAPAPIEGVFVQTPPSAASWIEVQVLVSGERSWTEWQSSGQFVGTKGRKLPLVGVRLQMTAAAPSELVMSASALFLGSPVISRAGRLVELVSQVGDPMVGFRFALEEEIRPISERAPANTATTPSAERGRVRVFRASREHASA